MGMGKPITVDFCQEQATSQVLTCPTLLSSREAGWSGLYLEYHYQLTHETPEHYPAQHVVAIQTEGYVQAERRLNGRLQREHVMVGHSCLVPAHTRHWIHSRGEQGLIFVVIEPAFLRRVAYDMIDADRIELMPHFAKSDPLIEQIGRSLKNALEADPVGSRFYADSLSIALCAHLLQYYATHHHSISTDKRAVANASVQQAIEYIHVHLTEDLSLLDIAATLGISQYHFCRLFKQTMGLTPWQYVIEQRIEAAKRLLVMPQLSIAQISRQLGYSTQGQFANFFRKHTGISPKAYRQKL